MTTFAHVGHWYLSLPIYLGPVVVIALWLAWDRRREKRQQRRDP